MKIVSKTGMAWALLSLLLVIQPQRAPAQQNVGDLDKRPPTNELFTSDLVAWTDMQTPEPVLQTTPNAELAPVFPRPVQPDVPAQNADVSAQSFSGTISKAGRAYVLRVANGISYQLDDQDRSRQFEGQRVTVLGALDSRKGLIHVLNIGPDS